LEGSTSTDSSRVAIADGRKGRTRNYYRESVVLFANWWRENGQLREHDLARLPKADPVRPRRALTEDEFLRLLAVARTRPLDDARTVRTGQRKGQRVADLRPDVVKRLDERGRERVLIYRTFLLTGLRLNELRTLTVARLDLTAGREASVWKRGTRSRARVRLCPCGRTWPTNSASGWPRRS